MMAVVVTMPCPKCGGETIVTRYHADRAACGYDACAGARYGHGMSKDEALWGKEHLSQRCDNCMYVWAVPTKTEKKQSDDR